MTNTQKRSLYESIMRDVAKTVKRHLNEDLFDEDLFDKDTFRDFNDNYQHDIDNSVFKFLDKCDVDTLYDKNNNTKFINLFSDFDCLYLNNGKICIDISAKYRERAEEKPEQWIDKYHVDVTYIDDLGKFTINANNFGELLEKIKLLDYSISMAHWHFNEIYLQIDLDIPYVITSIIDHIDNIEQRRFSNYNFRDKYIWKKAEINANYISKLQFKTSKNIISVIKNVINNKYI